MKLGKLFIILPPIGMIGTLIAFAVFNTLLVDGPQIRIVVNFILYIIGFLSTVGLIVLMPIGVIILIKEHSKQHKQ